MAKQQIEQINTVKIQVRLSRPLLKYILETTKEHQTKSERITELLLKGLEVTKCP